MKRRDLTHAERVAIVERHMGGATLGAIAERLELNLFTVVPLVACLPGWRMVGAKPSAERSAAARCARSLRPQSAVCGVAAEA